MDTHDKEHFRMLASMFAMQGMLMIGEDPDTSADMAIEFADALLKKFEVKAGLPAIKRRKKND